VSFVMPAHRPRPEWLREAVDSVLAQEGCEVDLVIVDDGSPEPLEPLLGGRAARVVRTAHGGAAAARNAALAHCRGDWVRYADADDVLPPESTARLLAHARPEPAVIGYGATMFCDAELRPRWRMSCRVRGEAALSCLYGGFTVRLPALLFPRALVERAGPWDPRLRVSSDWDFVLRALDHARVEGDGRVAALYRRHGGSLTADDEAGRAAARRIVAGFLERNPSHRGTAVERRALAMLDARDARIHAGRGRPARAAAAAARAAARDPRALAEELRQAGAAARGRLSALRG
jgi:glycosyltransferase involved in cell wall biosynthesis